MSSRITIVDIQHKTFKRALQGYDRTEVDQFLDEVIETLEDEAQARAALEAEIERPARAHLALQSDGRVASVDAAARAAHGGRGESDRPQGGRPDPRRGPLSSRARDRFDRRSLEEVRREHQRMLDVAAQAKSDIRSLLLSHLALIDRPSTVAAAGAAAQPKLIEEASPAPTPANGVPRIDVS